MSRKSKTEIESERRVLITTHVATVIGSIIGTSIRTAGFVAVAYYGYQIVNCLSGKVTWAKIGINLLTDMRVSEALAWLLAGGGVVYGQVERRLRKRTVERMHGHQKDLERIIDRGRSSSNLTKWGDPPKELR